MHKRMSAGWKLSVAAGLLALGSWLPLTLRAQTSVEPPASELAQHMSRLEENLRQVRRLIRQPQEREQTLALIVQMQQEVLAAKQATPTKAGELPEAERPAMVQAFRLAMVDLLRGLLDLERAVLAGEVEPAEAAVKSILELRFRSHRAFKAE